MKIGHRVTLLRKMRKMTQKELAVGIISVSHLSNLEGGRYAAANETIKLLAERLEVPNKYLIGNFETDHEIEKKLEDILNKMINSADEGKLALDFISVPLGNLYYDMSYYFLLGSYYYKKKLLESAEEIKKDYIEQFEYYINLDGLPAFFAKIYLYYYGISNFRENRLEKSFLNFKNMQAHQFPNHILADLHYNLGLISYKQVQFLKTIKYLESSLSLYINSSLWNKVGEIYNFLGGIYSYLDMYDEALLHLDKAINIAVPMNLHHIQGMVHHNKGLVYLKKGNIDESYNEFKIALKIKKKHNQQNILITLFEMIKINLSLNNHVLIKNMLKTTTQYISNTTDYYILLSIHADYNLLDKDEEGYQEKKRKCLKYFLENDFILEAIGISEDLGNFYFKKNKYKYAAFYYKQELEIKDKMKWEEMHNDN